MNQINHPVVIDLIIDLFSPFFVLELSLRSHRAEKVTDVFCIYANSW